MGLLETFLTDNTFFFPKNIFKTRSADEKAALDTIVFISVASRIGGYC